MKNNKNLKSFGEFKTFENIYDFIDWMEKNHPNLIEYKDEDATPDSVLYSIPYDVFNRTTGLDKNDIERISNDIEVNAINLGDGISCYNDMVDITIGI